MPSSKLLIACSLLMTSCTSREPVPGDDRSVEPPAHRSVLTVPCCQGSGTKALVEAYLEVHRVLVEGHGELLQPTCGPLAEAAKTLAQPRNEAEVAESDETHGAPSAADTEEGDGTSDGALAPGATGQEEEPEPTGDQMQAAEEAIGPATAARLATLAERMASAGLDLAREYHVELSYILIRELAGGAAPAEPDMVLAAGCLEESGWSWVQREGALESPYGPGTSSPGTCPRAGR